MRLNAPALYLVATLLFASESIAASVDSEPDDTIQEIVVTAQKRSESLSDVPMSITAASGSQLTHLRVSNTDELTRVVPGFTYQTSDYGTPVYTIRGIGFLDLALAAVPAVTTYIDEVPLPYSAMSRGATLDLERVEVLKGPQGTLFGQNSTGGAINYIAAKPTDSFESGLDVTYGRFNEVDAEGFLNVPIASGLDARLSVRHESRDAWQYSLSRRGDTLGKKDFDNVRLLMDWKPTDRLHFLLNLSGWYDGSEMPAVQFRAFIPKTPPNPQTQFVFDALGSYHFVPANARGADWDPATEYSGHRNFQHISLRGDWQMADRITLTSISAFSRLSVDQLADRDGTDFQNLDLRTLGLLRSYSQELRVSGDLQPLKWMLGANYQEDVSHENDADIFNGDNSDVGPFYFSHLNFIANQTARTKSGFGSLDYALSPTLTAQASVRYSAQDRPFHGCSADAGQGDAAAALGLLSTILGGTGGAKPGGCVNLDPVTLSPSGVISSLNQSNVSWRTGLDWKPDAGTLLYANISRGYKFGGFSVPAAILTTQFAPATQESVTAYETGFKLGFKHRRVQLNGAAFYYDYTDKQIIGTVNDILFGALTQLVNVPSSRVLGGELELVLQVTDGLRLANSVTYVDSRVQSNPPPPAASLDPLGNHVDFVGDRFPNTPRWQSVSDAEYDFPLTGTLSAFVGANYVYRSAANAALGNNPLFVINGYGLLDLRAGIESSRGWRAQVWGSNVTGKYYWTNVARVLSTLTRQAGMPGTFGVTVSYRFN